MQEKDVGISKGDINMEEKIVKVLNVMSEYLSIAQMKKLQEVILQTFAELFRRYLIAKCKNIVEEKLCDFKCNVDGKDICFELKIYNSDYAKDNVILAYG